jgi:sec-independent protein translocase protein TatA
MGLFDSPWHILIVLLVLVLLFGSAKLPKAAKSMGEAMRIFKKEAQKLHDDEPQQDAQAQVTPQQAAPPQQISTGQPTVSTGQPTAQEQMASLKQQMDALQQQVGTPQEPQGSGTAAPPTQATNQPS